MVDIGWLGTSRLMINSLLRQAGGSEIETVYFGVRGDVLSSAAGKYHSYFPEGKLDTGSTIIIESYYSQSPNPSVRRYMEGNGRIVPVWESNRREHESPSLEVNRRVIREMIREMIREVCAGCFPSDILYAWAKLSLEGIACPECGIDLTPLLRISDFDCIPFVKKMTFIELLQYSLGKRITAYDAGSLRLTVGGRIGNFLQKQHCLVLKLFYPLYRRIAR